ncbi:MAG: DNA-directed RNA polymerase subunit beta', partial [Flavobacteriales bacterium]|nr:DNA-directed RNA polymerase subunit beta' [Flavobacteriales bacterium]
GFMCAFRGVLSFNLNGVVLPDAMYKRGKAAQRGVDEVTSNYNMGLITNNERYNQTIDIWTHTNSKVTFTLMERLKHDNQGFNSIYMMMDSGARGSKEQIRQLSGMRGLMAKPQKSGGGGGQDIIENPILSNFKEGLSILEYFISTHGARKGLADTALKTADAGYLTRRLVDVAQDVVITEPDCGTLRGLIATALRKNEDLVESLHDRILGRTSVHDVYHPQTGELIVNSGDLIDEEVARIIEESPIEEVEIRSVLTCETKQGVCAKCYGRNLATGGDVQIGEAVGVIAAQSIGEPGTQLTLRTFHVGGVAGKITEESEIRAKYDGDLEIEELRTVKRKDNHGKDAEVVISRSAEMRVVDSNTGIVLTTSNIPYGAFIYVKPEQKIKKDDLICTWDPYNAVIISELAGKLEFESIEESVTYREEIDEQTGFAEKVIVESRDKKKNPTIKIMDPKGKEELKSYSLPVGAHIMVKEGQKVEAGDVLVKIPRSSGKGGDITGGLPRVTELFEARNPSNPAVVSEIDGIISYGKIKRGNREIIVESRTGERHTYLVPLSKHILVQENDFVKAGQQLSDGSTSPTDILNIQGPTAVQEYLVNEVQEVYRMQGVKINDKHFEVIVRQMMRKVEIEDPGDTQFLEKQAVNRSEFMDANDQLFDKVVVTDAGDSANLKVGQMITLRKLRDENSGLRRKDQKLAETRPAKSATARTLLQGITRASLQTNSFISAASFQETTKVLNEAAVNAKEDDLLGLKENVIVGHLIPAGTGTRRFRNVLVYNQDEYTRLMADKLTELEIPE